MFLKVWRVLTLLNVALLLTMAFAHLCQLALRIGYESPIWFRTLHRYHLLGPAGPNPAIDVSAILGTLLLWWLVRDRKAVARWTLVGGGALFISLVLRWMFVQPFDGELERWTSERLATDGMNARWQWGYTHAGRALLTLIAFSALLRSMLVELWRNATASPQRKVRTRVYRRIGSRSMSF